MRSRRIELDVTMVQRIPLSCLIAISIAASQIILVPSALLFAYAFTTPIGQSVLQKQNILTTTSPPSRPLDVCCWAATMPTEAESSVAQTVASSSSGGQQRNSKLRQLKDRMWVREALEDITAAEFASSLSLEDASESDADSSGNIPGEARRKKKRAVDFDNVLNKLDARIEEMCVVTSEEISKEMNQICHTINRPVLGDEEGTMVNEKLCYSLADNIGMGSVVYTADQREALLSRLIGTRERLVEIKLKRKNEGQQEGRRDSDDKIEDIDEIRSQMQTEDAASATEKESEDGSKGSTTFDPSLYVSLLCCFLFINLMYINLHSYSSLPITGS